MEILLGVAIGWAMAASLVAANRRLHSEPAPPEPAEAMRTALHAASAILPDMRRGLSEATAARAVVHLRMLMRTAAIAIGDDDHILAYDGLGAEHHQPGDPIASIASDTAEPDKPHIDRVRCEHASCELGSAVTAQLMVANEPAGKLVALYPRGHRITRNETRMVADAATLVSGQLELHGMDEQAERLAQAELNALRAQISPRVERALRQALADAESTERDGVKHAGGEGPTGMTDEIIPVEHHRGGATRLLDRATVLYVKAEGDYVRLYADDGRFLVRTPLSEIEHRWGPHGFVRVHRSYVANLRRAVEIKPELGGAVKIVLADGSEVPVARRHVADLRRRLGM